MNDYISRQAAIDICNDELLHTEDYSPIRTWGRIMELPSAQPEIVRCKDCIHFATVNEPYNETFCRLCFINKSEMGYCDKAERRTDGVDS